VLRVFDFYDPLKHTEISIERARNAYPPFPGTEKIDTSAVPLHANSADLILLILSAHEIRNHKERSDFFKQLNGALSDHGRIVVVEHQRDLPNFMAYTIGFFHFLSGRIWKETFVRAHLVLDEKKKITPFLSIFILKKHGITS
jgi:hypothetical protein